MSGEAKRIARVLMDIAFEDDLSRREQGLKEVGRQFYSSGYQYLIDYGVEVYGDMVNVFKFQFTAREYSDYHATGSRTIDLVEPRNIVIFASTISHGVRDFVDELIPPWKSFDDEKPLFQAS